jgi:hypothetical protein
VLSIPTTQIGGIGREHHDYLPDTRRLSRHIENPLNAEKPGFRVDQEML